MTQSLRVPAALACNDHQPILFSGDDLVTVDGVLRTWAGPGDEEWADQVVTSLGTGERAVGVLSFKPGGPAVMHQVVGSRPLPAMRPPAVIRDHRVTEHPTRGEYARSVRTALARIAEGRVAKVVVGRCLDIVSTPPLQLDEVVARLISTRPGRYVFGVPLTEDMTGPVLVGASPELLVCRRGPIVRSLPLAGSVPRSPDPVEDASRADELLGSSKDHAEHAFVVDQIVATLRGVATEVHADPSPRLLATDTLWHLATSIRARLTPGRSPSALHLARLLHPTPAVGGVPTEPALAAIEEVEGPDLRGPLAGVVGWVDSAGDGEFALAIRAGVLHGERLRLFAGAGIVAGSDPEAEVRETSAKLETMARAVGL